MAKILETTAKWAMIAERNWVFDLYSLSRPPYKTFNEVNEDIRLRRALRRAVKKDLAPQGLIDAIRSGIRG